MALLGLERALIGYDENYTVILKSMGKAHTLSQEVHPPASPFTPELSGPSSGRPHVCWDGQGEHAGGDTAYSDSTGFKKRARLLMPTRVF